MKETAVLINVKDRPTELAMLLESLMFQTYQNFDVFILDDVSGTPLTNYHFFNCIVSLLRRKKIKVYVDRTQFPHGVSKARQSIVDWAMKGEYEYFCRVDDDVVLEPDFLQKLINVIEQDYDISSGVTPPMGIPTFVRNPITLKGIANRVILDEEGNYILNADDCGSQYTSGEILPMHHFRSSALMKREVLEKVKYLPTKLTKHGFREEQIFSYKAIMKGFKIGVDLGAIAWHQLTPSGGERFAESNELVKINQQVLEEFTKENKDMLQEFNNFEEKDMPSKLELQKENNLLMK